MKTSCIACQGLLVKIGEKHGFSLWQCPNCGLGVTEKGLSQDYSHYHRDTTYIKEDKQFENIFAKRVNVILKHKKRGKALEIGSSTGLLLSILQKHGWQVQGVEPSKKAATYAQSSGIPTQIQTFEKFNSKEMYDVIIFNHVLEHVDDPLSFLLKSYSLLNKKGIVFIDVPHFGSFSAKLKKENWEYLLPEEHDWHYTKKSLKLLLEKTGFEYIYSETHSGIWGYGNPLSELSQSFFGLKKRFIRNFLTAIPAYLITKIGLGTGLTILGRKK